MKKLSRPVSFRLMVRNAKSVRAALVRLVNAWEQLEGGKYSVSIVEAWLVEDMKPAIDRARRVLGRKIPNEQE